MVGLQRFIVLMYPLSQVLLYIWLVYHDLLYRCTLLGRFDCIYGWFTTICCIDVPFKAGLTVYMVGLPRFVVYMYPLRQD